VDYLKLHWYNTGKQNAGASSQTMHKALLRTGPLIVFSMVRVGHRKSMPSKEVDRIGSSGVPDIAIILRHISADEDAIT
jgi:hypothetical protein